MPSILDRNTELVQQEVAKVASENPNSFRVGGTFDGQTVSGGASFNRTWTNGWGATAYARAWWNDTSVIPTGDKKLHGVVGVEGRKSF